MAASEAPIVVLVHGAWHGAWCWAALQSALDARGVPSLAVDLPGHGASLAELGDLHGDAAAVRSVIDRLDSDVVLVGHSYGGAVITQAAAGAGNVGHLVYLAAFVPDEGDSVLEMNAAMPQADSTLAAAIVIADGSSTIDPSWAAKSFYAMCDPLVADAAVARLGTQTLSSFTQPVTQAAWKTIPSTYVRCTLDQAVPISHQDLMAKACTNLETLETDHSPFVSKAAETADIIERVVRSISPPR